MNKSEVLKIFYSESESDGTIGIIVARNLTEACEALVTQLEESNGKKVDPSSLSLTEVNPSKPKVLTFTPPNGYDLGRPRFL